MRTPSKQSSIGCLFGTKFGRRLADSIETSLRWGGGMLTVIRMEPGAEKWTEQKFSTDYCNPSTGFTMPKLTPKHFSFNSHLGACPACHGIGTELFFDADLMVDNSKTLEQGAIKPWRVGHKRMKHYYGADPQWAHRRYTGADRCAVQGSPDSTSSRCCSSAAAIGRLPSR